MWLSWSHADFIGCLKWAQVFSTSGLLSLLLGIGNSSSDQTQEDSAASYNQTATRTASPTSNAANDHQLSDSDTRSVQENFDLLTSFIQDSADKHMPSKTSRSVSSIPLITTEIRRKIRRKNKTHAKAKKTGSSKLRSKFEILRREIKADVRKQHDLYVNNLVDDVKANPRDFYRYINSQKKDTQGIPPLKGKNGKGIARTSKRQRNSMVSLRMCSIKMNTPRSRFWIGLHLS